MECRKCGSSNVSCSSEYYSTGADMESVEWKHICGDCYHEESDTQQGCYGYDNHYNCPFNGCDNEFPWKT